MCTAAPSSIPIHSSSDRSASSTPAQGPTPGSPSAGGRGDASAPPSRWPRPESCSGQSCATPASNLLGGARSGSRTATCSSCRPAAGASSSKSEHPIPTASLVLSRATLHKSSNRNQQTRSAAGAQTSSKRDCSRAQGELATRPQHALAMDERRQCEAGRRPLPLRAEDGIGIALRDLARGGRCPGRAGTPRRSRTRPRWGRRKPPVR